MAPAPPRPGRRHRRAWVVLAVAAAALPVGACGRSDETATTPAAGGGAPTSRADTADGADGAPPSTLPVAPATTVDPGTLPQTEDKPSVDSPAFQERLQALWTGIVDDDPEAALPFFFPLSAYRQVKPIKDPDGDWKNRLVGTYEREIHALHQQLGKDPAAAKLEGIDVPTANAQWMKPGTENNKLPYWRVLNSKVRYSVNGQPRSFVVSSMISWRGEWYVVHLTAPPR